MSNGFAFAGANVHRKNHFSKGTYGMFRSRTALLMTFFIILGFVFPSPL